jgi:hypothetical protein
MSMTTPFVRGDEVWGDGKPGQEGKPLTQTPLQVPLYEVIACFSNSFFKSSSEKDHPPSADLSNLTSTVRSLTLRGRSQSDSRLNGEFV